MRRVIALARPRLSLPLPLSRRTTSTLTRFAPSRGGIDRHEVCDDESSGASSTPVRERESPTAASFLPSFLFDDTAILRAAMENEAEEGRADARGSAVSRAAGCFDVSWTT